MDFSLKYTDEQEKFAKEVREWLKHNVPKGIPTQIADGAKLTYDQWQQQREFAHQLGLKGWRSPMFPVEYGGGGLTIDHATVLEQELNMYDLRTVPCYDLGVRLAAPAIFAWGNEEQKKRFLPPILRGDVITWQLFTEPEAGSDLANIKTQAIRKDGHFVINGTKTLVGGLFKADQFWMLCCTRPQNPKHHNLGIFIVPANLPGVSAAPLDLFTTGKIAHCPQSGIKNSVYFDNVEIEEFRLVGGETDGWKIANTTLGIEQGGGGSVLPNPAIVRFLNQCRTNPSIKKRVASNPELLNEIVDIHIAAEIERLFGLRNYWLRHTKKPLVYEGNQYWLEEKLFGPKLALTMLKVLGPQALVEDDRWGLEEGVFELTQRDSLAVSPGGTPEIQKLRIARALKLGQTQESSGRK